MRPFILVLAGVNGAGKSSVAGSMLQHQGHPWFNPDTLARKLMEQGGFDREEANGLAWAQGKSALEHAIANRTNFTFETTLGGSTITRLLLEASKTHDVMMLYCGLSSPAMHIERVAQRVQRGGHPIADANIHERWNSSRLNLIRLLPALEQLQVFDNSATVRVDQAIPNPVVVLEMNEGRVVHPRLSDAKALQAVPEWARPIVEAALRLQGRA